MASVGTLSADITDGGFFILAGTVMYCYDYIITFGEEVRCVWKRRASGASILFVVGRYAMLAASLASIAQVLPWNQQPDVDIDGGVYDTYGSAFVSLLLPTRFLSQSHMSSCDFPIRFVDVCLILSNLAYAWFAALRMFALYGMCKSLFWTVLGMGLINPCTQILVMGVVIISEQESPGRIGVFSPFGRINCIRSTIFDTPSSSGDDAGTYAIFYFIAALRVHAIIFEAILILLTWRKMDVKWTFKRSTLPAPIITIMFKNGILYFLIIAFVSILNILGMATMFILPKIANPTHQLVHFAAHLSSICLVTDAMTTICMSRFIIDLITLTLDNQESQPEFSQWNSIHFAAVVEATVADIGADLTQSLKEVAGGRGEREADREGVVVYDAAATTRIEVAAEV